MKATEALTCLAKLSPWLQGLWVVWVLLGTVLLLVSWNICSKNLLGEPAQGSTVISRPTSLPNEEIEKPKPDKEGWIVIVVPGADKEGKVAAFEINILSQEFNWAYESAVTVELNGKSQDMREHFSSPGLQYRFGRSLALIAVGAASEEGSREFEEGRAWARAKQLAVWLVESLQAPARVYKLNLGHFKTRSRVLRGHEESAAQRSIVIIGVVEQEEGVILEEALRSAWTKSVGIPFNLEDYSRFDLKPHD